MALNTSSYDLNSTTSYILGIGITTFLFKRFFSCERQSGLHLNPPPSWTVVSRMLRPSTYKVQLSSAHRTSVYTARLPEAAHYIRSVREAEPLSTHTYHLRPLHRFLDFVHVNLICPLATSSAMLDIVSSDNYLFVTVRLNDVYVTRAHPRFNEIFRGLIMFGTYIESYVGVWEPVEPPPFLRRNNRILATQVYDHSVKLFIQYISDTFTIPARWAAAEAHSWNLG